MREKLLGIKAIADGLLDGGCEIATNFPGFMSHKLFSLLGGKITSTNEKIAYETAWGASFAGKRSAVMFKNVGLNDAADPFLNSMIIGVNAGLVVVVFDDIQVESSQSRQDSRHYFDFEEGLWFEPYSLQNAYDTAYQAFTLSEKFQIPIVIRITNQMIYQKGKYIRRKKQIKTLPIIKDHKRFVIHPVNSRIQREAVIKRNNKIRNFINRLYSQKLHIINQNKNKKLLLSFGCNILEEKKYLSNGFKKLQVFTYPFPGKIQNLMKNTIEVVVLEQGDKFAYEKVKLLMTSNKQRIRSDSGFIPDNSTNYIISNKYERLFLAIKQTNPTLVISDLGEYTQDTLDSTDACLCFGSSLSVAMGVFLAGVKKVISIIGDGAYLHSGKNVIPEAIERKTPLKIIVICNKGCQSTGGQEIPGNLFYQPPEVKKYILEYNTKMTDIEEVLSKMMNSNTVSVLYILM